MAPELSAQSAPQLWPPIGDQQPRSHPVDIPGRGTKRPAEDSVELPDEAHKPSVGNGEPQLPPPERASGLGAAFKWWRRNSTS